MGGGGGRVSIPPRVSAGGPYKVITYTLLHMRSGGGGGGGGGGISIPPRVSAAVLVLAAPRCYELMM